ncbi:hypothetical protein Xbed_03472 [Xenorhabdus beddingii]|uniref:Uncharacterized protein n=1 Tax=Xenorhabdus beddingii TaxID=40578 RepID=A0A1Y2SFG7_9GAMM|nr:hypothetical protein Xbed_03472 [Xenorhabdus beddingii]
MRNNMRDGMAVVPTQPQAIRNRRAWKRRIALFLISIVVFIPV